MAEYIERYAALKICDDAYRERLAMQDYCGDTVAWNIGGDIKLLPAANVEPVRRGEWRHTHTGSSYFNECLKCTYCGFEDTELCVFNYCPNCGAKMDLED